MPDRHLQGPEFDEAAGPGFGQSLLRGDPAKGPIKPGPNQRDDQGLEAPGTCREIAVKKVHRDHLVAQMQPAQRQKGDGHHVIAGDHLGGGVHRDSEEVPQEHIKTDVQHHCQNGGGGYQRQPAAKAGGKAGERHAMS
jgi:hypothetical protein